MLYPLANQYNYENHHFLWTNQLEMTIDNSYVSVPEGIIIFPSAESLSNSPSIWVLRTPLGGIKGFTDATIRAGPEAPTAVKGTKARLGTGGHGMAHVPGISWPGPGPNKLFHFVLRPNFPLLARAL